MPKDYYSILGVKKDASEDEIKKAFRRLAHEHHPDKGGDSKKFKDINEANQVLGDKEKRAKYDQFGSAAFEQGGGFDPRSAGFGGFGGGGGGGFNINMDDVGDLGEMFGEMFGFRGQRGPKKQRGNDIQTEVVIEFLEAVRGVKKTIRLYKNDPCSRCNGKGGEPGSTEETCKTCKGQGSVQQSVRTVFGNVQTSVACPDCRGVGKKQSKVCTVCQGIGVERKTQELKIELPAGIDDGEAVKITGAGEFPGVGGQAGDLFVRVRVKSHPVFSREENDISSTVRIPYSTLVLGGVVQIETVDGSGELRIPEGTEPGTVFKIRHKGVPYLRSSSRGDHLATVQPLSPKKLNKEQRKLLEQLRDSQL